jgi:hypothetical protein
MASTHNTPKLRIAALLFAAGAIAGAAQPASAQSCSSTNVSGYVYTNCSNGTSYTSSQVGGYTYTNGSNGTSCTSTNVSGTVYTNCNGGH